MRQFFYPISLIELEYSLFNRNIEKEILPIARELGIGVVAFGALAHGLLNGTWTKDKEHINNTMIPLYYKENIEKNLSLVDALKKNYCGEGYHISTACLCMVII